jgi:hypothetical protein
MQSRDLEKNDTRVLVEGPPGATAAYLPKVFMSSESLHKLC